MEYEPECAPRALRCFIEEGNLEQITGPRSVGSVAAQRVRIDSMLVRISYRDISVEYKFTNGGDLLERLTRPRYNSFSLPLSNSWPCFETKDGNVLANTA